MTTRLRTICIPLLAVLGGCGGYAAVDTLPDTGEEDESPPPVLHVQGTFSPSEAVGGLQNTFHHPQSLDGTRVADAREVLARMAEEGPPAYRARLHGCRKMRYGTIGRVLAGLGVDLGATGATSAGAMYRGSDQALGAPNYAARIPETTELTTASASRLFDILVQAAPEIIANLPNVERCRIGDRGAAVFDASGRCTTDGLTCLLGVPASAAQVAFCNEYVSRATTPEKGRILAVASMLAAAVTCE
jgi:hypothetical protein